MLPFLDKFSFVSADLTVAINLSSPVKGIHRVWQINIRLNIDYNMFSTGYVRHTRLYQLI